MRNKNKFWKNVNQDPQKHVDFLAESLNEKNFVKTFVLLLPVIDGYIRSLLYKLQPDKKMVWDNDRVQLGTLIDTLQESKYEGDKFDRKIIRGLRECNNIRRKILHQGLYYEDIREIEEHSKRFCDVGFRMMDIMMEKYGKKIFLNPIR
jgi:hypothetical protein